MLGANLFTSGKLQKCVVITDLLVSPVQRLEHVVRIHMGLGANILSSHPTSGACSEKFNPFSFFFSSS